MEKERPYTCMQRRKEGSAPNKDPSMVQLEIPHPITAEIYYSAGGQIDRCNRCFQESLEIFKN